MHGRLSQRNSGVGSIIGAVFVALILLSGFAFYALILDTTQHYNDTMGSMSDMDWSRNQENIMIKQVSITSTNQLNVTAENDGSIQSHIIYLGLFNTTATPQNQTYQALNEFVRPGETDNIVSNFTVTSGNQYVVQLVTEFGNTVESKFYPANYAGCALALVTNPPTVYQGNNVTVLFTVTPNDTVVDSIQSLTATINATPTNLVQLVGNSSLTVNGLTRGTSAFFWWTYNTTNTGTVTFNATYLQAPAGTYASTTAQIASAPQAGQGSMTVTSVNCTAPQNPAQWNLLGSTQNVSGSISDLASNDSNYAIFRSYYTGTTTFATSYVSNNVSNVDSSTNKGTHSNFTAQKYGQDSVFDNLTEQDFGQGSATFGKTNIGSTSLGYTGWLEASRYQCGKNGSVTNMSLYLSGGAAGEYARVAIYSDNNGAPNSLLGQSGEQQIAASGWYNFTGISVTVTANVYYWLAFQMSSSNLQWRYDTGVTNQHAYRTYTYGSFPASFGSPNYGTEAQSIYASSFDTKYQLDLEEQWTGLNPSQQNASLCIYGGTMAAENILVDAWNGSWQNVFPNLNPGWNNQSVISYLTSSNFTIRFRAQNSTDVVQDSWQIDVSLLQFSNTTDAYTAEVEFTGTSNLQNWTGLAWFADSSWDTSNVTVTIQVYNYTLLSYPSSGNGYYTYVSSATAYTDETKSQTITSGATQFRNSTSPYYWKIKIKGVKATSTQFQMRIDWIELQDSYAYSGDTIPCNAWVWYTIQAAGAGGNPLPFTYASIYANGTTVTFQNATDGTAIPNPAWLRLDANGTFQLQLKSTTSSGETFVLSVAVGIVVQQKTITQAAQQ